MKCSIKTTKESTMVHSTSENLDNLPMESVSLIDKFLPKPNLKGGRISWNRWFSDTHVGNLRRMLFNPPKKLKATIRPWYPGFQEEIFILIFHHLVVPKHTDSASYARFSSTLVPQTL